MYQVDVTEIKQLAKTFEMTTENPQVEEMTKENSPVDEQRTYADENTVQPGQSDGFVKYLLMLEASNWTIWSGNTADEINLQ